MIIADKKFCHMLPEQIGLIVDKMIEPFADEERNLNFEQFRRFLDANQTLRDIVKESLKPQLWSISDKGKCQPQLLICIGVSHNNSFSSA